MLTIHDALIGLTASPTCSDESAERLQQARDLFERLKTTEAAHVTKALGDPSFEFCSAQGALAEQRETFGVVVRDLARNDHVDGAQRRHLRDMAYLLETAPLTTFEDLEAIRKARSSRRPRLAAV